MRRLLIFLAGCIVGCAYTFNPSSIPGHIKTMEIPVLVNETLEVALAEEVTAGLIDRFVRDNALRVVQGDADAVLEGTITGYENRVFGFNADQRADEYIVILMVDLTFRDRVKNKEIWSRIGVRGSASYFLNGATGGVTSEEAARELAVKQVVDFAISRTTEGW